MSLYKGNTQVELRAPQKSVFDLSHEKKLSTRMGRLTPILIKEAIPGDKFSGGSEILLRLAPLLAPIYDSITLYVHYFFVPNRLLWEDWEEFITGGRLGTGIDPVTAPIPPYIDLEKFIDAEANIESELGDYLDVPILPGAAADYNGMSIDAMPFLVYQKCWFDYYRDRNFIADDYFDVEMPVPSGELDISDPQVLSYVARKNRDWLKGYFTAALPFTQRGTEVLMPLAGTGSVTYLENTLVGNAAGGVVSGNGDLVTIAADTPSGALRSTLNTNIDVQIQNIDEVNLDSSAVSINDLRSAVRLQEWLERNAVAGSRYTESIQAHFAVKPQDSRLQRAEFIGGGRIPVKISEVVNTAFSLNEADETIPAGNLAGHGVTFGNTNRFSYFAPEHGFIIGIMSIMARDSYYQGLPRMFKRKTFLDYPWPTFAKLGEQPVYKYEIYANAANLEQDADGEETVFGYQSRYADWKQSFSTNNGAFRSTLLFWTLARTFINEANVPVLDANFVAFTDSVQNRIFAVTGSEDNFWCYIHNDIKVVRALPYFGTPTL